ncbi:unnamed protein product [Cyclocybe aegerita]|uniref:SH3 domain-containing protein n=1 Tax=Cyclocybe aegerita TaxID=1973307 RepID=A0A8S0VZQ1_CYCAE|nr:unnamed protein product [Cyclocybe aegerita]
MVFANLGSHEKEAFFSLLDEYFSSRPDIFASPDATTGPQSGTAAVSAVQRAMAANPEATAKVMSAGLRHVAANSRTVSGGGPGATGASDNEVPSVAGRVAAFAAANRSSFAPATTTSSATADRPSSSTASLTSIKKFGDVDTSSTKAFLGSLRNSNSNKAPPQPPVVPAAFAARQSNFGPPPVRRGGSSPTPEPASAPAPPPVAPRYQPPPKQEESEGEWAEAIYDYDSGEPGDLKITEGERILLTERTSDDWWVAFPSFQPHLISPGALFITPPPFLLINRLLVVVWPRFRVLTPLLSFPFYPIPIPNSGLYLDSASPFQVPH